jgi:protein O-mannosyl-transferase
MSAIAPQSFFRPPDRRTIWFSAAAIFIAALLAYANSFSGAQLFDDRSTLTENPSIRTLWPLSVPLSPPSTNATGGRPLANLTFALNYAWSGFDVTSYHGVNLIIHALAGLVLAALVRRTLQRPALSARFGAMAAPLAALIAVIWTIHPVQTVTVTYLSQRTEELVGLLYLLTLYCFVRGVDGSPGRWHVGAVVTCLLGVASKEIIVTVPLVVLLYDRTLVARSFRRAWEARWRTYVGLAAAVSLGLLWLMRELPKRGVGFELGISSWHYALTECKALITYLRLGPWPHPLIFDYGPDAFERVAQALPYALGLLPLFWLTIVGLRRNAPAGFAATAVVTMLAPTSSFIPVALQPIGENRVYLPLAVIVTLGGLALYTTIGRRSLIILIAIATALGVLTVRRNADYRSELAIWNDTAVKRPDSARAHYNLGLALAHAERYDEAAAEYQETLRLKPDHVKARNNLGNLFVRRGDLDLAIAAYQRALHDQPDFVDAHVNLGVALSLKGQTEQAITHFRLALHSAPRSPEANFHLGEALLNIGQPAEAASVLEIAVQSRPNFAAAYHYLGNARFQLGQLPEAITAFQRALQLDPNLAEAANNLGMVFLREGRSADAVPLFEKAAQLKPDYLDAHYNLGTAWLQIGKYESAGQEFNRVLRLDPKHIEAHNNLGFVLARQGHLTEAVAQFETALTIKPDYQDAKDNLAKIKAELEANARP